jgi:hypothetical protein
MTIRSITHDVEIYKYIIYLARKKYSDTTIEAYSSVAQRIYEAYEGNISKILEKTPDEVIVDIGVKSNRPARNRPKIIPFLEYLEEKYGPNSL